MAGSWLLCLTKARSFRRRECFFTINEAICKPKSHELNQIVLKKTVLSKFQTCSLLTPMLAIFHLPTSKRPFPGSHSFILLRPRRLAHGLLMPVPRHANFAGWVWPTEAGHERQKGRGAMLPLLLLCLLNAIGQHWSVTPAPPRQLCPPVPSSHWAPEHTCLLFLFSSRA